MSPKVKRTGWHAFGFEQVTPFLDPLIVVLSTGFDMVLVWLCPWLIWERKAIAWIGGSFEVSF